MAKALLVGDLHIENSKNSIANSDSFQEVFNTFNLIRDSIEKYRPEYTIFFGDIFNNPYSITTPVISIISKLISEISMETSVLLLIGNHDDVDNKCNNVKIGDSSINIRSSLLAPFAYYNNVVVFDKPTVVRIDNTNVELALVPYSNNIIDNLNNIKNKFAVGTKRVLMGHFDMKQGYHMIIQNQTDVSINLPTPEDLIEKYNYDMVLLGHIHDSSETYVNDKLLKYIGSCRNVDFRNTGEQKGIYIMDFNDLSLEYIDNPFTNIYKIFHNIDEFSQYCSESSEEKLSKTKIQYVYTDSKDIKEISKLKHFFKSINFQKSILEGNNLCSSNISVDAFKEFENLINNNLITKDKLVDYALQFKEPVNKNKALDLIKFFNLK